MAGYLGKTPIAGACDVGARQPDVISELKSLGFATESVRSSAQRLAERLVGVLRLPTPTNCGESDPAPPLCPVADAIRRESWAVRDTDAILCDLLDRLEI
jgi:hypothetical protein